MESHIVQALSELFRQMRVLPLPDSALESPVQSSLRAYAYRYAMVHDHAGGTKDDKGGEDLPAGFDTGMLGNYTAPETIQRVRDATGARSYVGARITSARWDGNISSDRSSIMCSPKTKPW